MPTISGQMFCSCNSHYGSVTGNYNTIIIYLFFIRMASRNTIRCVSVMTEVCLNMIFRFFSCTVACKSCVPLAVSMSLFLPFPLQPGVLLFLLFVLSFSISKEGGDRMKDHDGVTFTKVLPEGGTEFLLDVCTVSF